VPARPVWINVKKGVRSGTAQTLRMHGSACGARRDQTSWRYLDLPQGMGLPPAAGTPAEAVAECV